MSRAIQPEHRILIWMCVLIAVNQLGFGAIVPALPLYARAFGVPVSAVGMAVAVYGLARFCIAVPTGPDGGPARTAAPHSHSAASCRRRAIFGARRPRDTRSSSSPGSWRGPVPAWS